LAALGFPKVQSLDIAALDSDAPEMLLLAAGHAHWFDVETGMYPNEHDSLLRTLAGLVEPALVDAIFEEQLPAHESDGSPYTLTAYLGGKRYRTPAENLGDWYDVAAILRLLNAMLADRRAEERFIVLASEDQTAIIVGAPRTALEKAVQQKLLTIGNAGDAERVGKEYEEQVLKSLRD
jgi:hypothetical protein